MEKVAVEVLGKAFAVFYGARRQLIGTIQRAKTPSGFRYRIYHLLSRATETSIEGFNHAVQRITAIHEEYAKCPGKR